jgi:hypothetical protein
VNVYGVQHGEFGANSKITLIVTLVSAVICGGLALLYSQVMIKRVKRVHNQQIGRERAGKHGEGFLEEIKRKAREVEPEAGAV